MDEVIDVAIQQGFATNGCECAVHEISAELIGSAVTGNMNRLIGKSELEQLFGPLCNYCGEEIKIS